MIRAILATLLLGGCVASGEFNSSSDGGQSCRATFSGAKVVVSQLSFACEGFAPAGAGGLVPLPVASPLEPPTTTTTILPAATYARPLPPPRR